MAFSITEASIEILDKDRRSYAELLIRPSSKSKHNTLFEATELESKDWGEERIQILEECRYEYELKCTGTFQLREIPNIITRSVLPNRSNTGTIEPKSNVGLFPIVLEDTNGNKVAETAIEVRSKKLEYREHYRTMLNYIADKCTDLLLQIRSPSQGRFRPKISEASHTIAQRFYFIKSLLSNMEFQSSLSKILSDPHVRSGIREQEQEVNRGFIPNRHNLRQIGSKYPRIKINKGSKIYNYLTSVPKKITTQKHMETVDTPENRFIKYVLESFDVFLYDMVTVLVSRKIKPSDERLISEIVSLRKNLSTPLSHNLFRGLSQPTFLPLGSPVLQRREGYREILLAWIKFDAASRLVWSGGNDVYGSGKKDVATLYEYWIFFKLLDLVSAVFKLRLLKIEDLIEETEDGFALKLKTGKRLLIEDISNEGGRPIMVRFSYNRTFSRSDPSEKISFPKPGSWTKTLRPDYSLSIWPAEFTDIEAENLELIWHVHFDSKYKIENKYGYIPDINDVIGADSKDELYIAKKTIKNSRHARHSDLQTMHAYRDAIRRTEGAYIIYPGSESRIWRKYYEILPGLGAFAVNPGDEIDGLGCIHHFLIELSAHIRNRATLRERERYYSYITQRSSKTSGVFKTIPELEQNGERAKPIGDHFVLYCESLGTEHLDWVLKTGSINVEIVNRQILGKLFLVNHLVIFDNDAVALGPLIVVQEKTMLKTASDLINEGCPCVYDSELIHVVFSVIPENRQLMKNIDWGIMEKFKFDSPYICNLEEILSCG